MADWIAWNDDLLVNIVQIDDQHRELFRRFNVLGDAVWDGKGKQVIGETLDFLAEYTVQHFNAEEELMREYQYPALITHKKAHDNFVQEVQAFINDFASKDVDSGLIISVVNKLGDWTRNHIRRMDKELGEFILTR